MLLFSELVITTVFNSGLHINKLILEGEKLEPETQ